MSSFLVMPVVTAVVWKNMLLNPVFGFLSWLVTLFGGTPVDFLANHAMGSIIAMVTWEWTPFAMLILLTGLQSLPDDQIEAARLDGACPWQEFRFVVLPHWMQALEVVILLETINVLQVYGEIYASLPAAPASPPPTCPTSFTRKPLPSTTSAWRVRQAYHGGPDQYPGHLPAPYDEQECQRWRPRMTTLPRPAVADAPAERAAT